MRHPLCSVDRKFKRQGDHVRIVISNTLILPTKGTWSNVIKPFPPHQSNGGEERAWGGEGSQIIFCSGIRLMEM